eukprot:16443255-Heterocapsa_arctica.AAC.1
MALHGIRRAGGRRRASRRATRSRTATCGPQSPGPSPVNSEAATAGILARMDRTGVRAATAAATAAPTVAPTRGVAT